jgi:serine protease AprX
MQHTRRLAELVLYGTGDQRRFVQDGAIFMEVWIALIEGNGAPVALLLQPYLDLAPASLARRLHEAGIDAGRHRLVYNNNLVSLQADVRLLISVLAPATAWYCKAVRPESGHAHQVDAEQALLRFRDPFDAAEHAIAHHLWADLPLWGSSNGGARGVPRQLLSSIRIAGVTGYLTLVEKNSLSGGERAHRLLQKLVTSDPASARKQLTRVIAAGWKAIRKRGLTVSTPASLIHSITCDRAAFLAVADSRKTIKADAAQALFGMSCKGIRWAIVDSGIDATHPAFRKPASASRGDAPRANQAARLADSRVRATYDFSHLREILIGEIDALPERFEKKSLATRVAAAQKRADEFKPIDWGLLLPLLEIAPADYVVPIDRHGTHVAGTLAADWADGPRGPMKGVCCDIELIDVRVCKDDGTSSEFVVTAALQFLRYLNAHADMMVVHGVNMSLSLEHDVANYACGRTPVCLEAERTVGSGVVVVAAAGNRGYRHIRAADESSFYQFCAVSITDPGNAEGVITVGSTHRREPHNFGVSYFSSRGPTGDGRIKPDLVAPGEKIYAPAPGDDAVTLDGTSMAAPHVSGAAALLMARNPELVGQPDRIKSILCSSATDLGRERYFQGHGLLDVLRALQSV